MQFSLRARDPVSHPEVCGPFPCVLLFPTKDSTDAIASGDVIRMSLLRSAGHTVVIVEGGNGDDEKAFAETASLLRAVHFRE